MVWTGFATEVIIQMNFIWGSLGLDGRRHSGHLLLVSAYALTSRTDDIRAFHTNCFPAETKTGGGVFLPALSAASFLFVFFCQQHDQTIHIHILESQDEAF